MPQEMPDNRTKPADVVHGLSVVSGVASFCITPFFRVRFGSRAFFAAPFSFVLLSVYTEAHRSPIMQYYLIAWCVMVVIRRLTASRNVHSFYQGDPLFGVMNNYFVARITEMFVLFFAAVFAAMVSMALANFFLYGILAMFIALGIEQAREKAILRTIGDNEIMADYMNNLRRNNARR
jgi:hypothetical protein